MNAVDRNVVDRALALFRTVARVGEGASLATIAAQHDVPLSTAQRWMRLFEQHGLLVQTSRGNRSPGLTLLDLARGHCVDDVLRQAFLPLLQRYARVHRETVHVGVWDGEMVSYIARAAGRDAIFTREGMKLEAYCSGIGKILLANLPEGELNAYLEDGPFVALTEHTIVDPHALRSELHRVNEHGYALDAEEVQSGLTCCAMPIRNCDGKVVAAVSISVLHGDKPSEPQAMVQRLAPLRRSLEQRLGAPQSI